MEKLIRAIGVWFIVWGGVGISVAIFWVAIIMARYVAGGGNIATHVIATIFVVATIFAIMCYFD